MKDYVSPEEKLLRLIRGQKKQPRGQSSPGPVAPVTGTGIQAIRPGLRQIRETSAPNYRRYVDINRLLAAAFILSVCYLIYTLAYPFYGFSGIRAAKQDKYNRRAIDKPQAQQEQAQPADYYLSGIAGKQIFSASAVTQKLDGKPAAVNTDLLKDLNLVGIIAGDSPQAIIEDRKLQKTYYVNKGQIISEFQVEAIEDGKVALSREGQIYELHL